MEQGRGGRKAIPAKTRGPGERASEKGGEHSPGIWQCCCWAFVRNASQEKEKDSVG